MLYLLHQNTSLQSSASSRQLFCALDTYLLPVTGSWHRAGPKDPGSPNLQLCQGANLTSPGRNQRACFGAQPIYTLLHHAKLPTVWFYNQYHGKWHQRWDQEWSLMKEASRIDPIWSGTWERPESLFWGFTYLYQTVCKQPTAIYLCILATFPICPHCSGM